MDYVDFVLVFVLVCGGSLVWVVELFRVDVLMVFWVICWLEKNFGKVLFDKSCSGYLVN